MKKSIFFMIISALFTLSAITAGKAETTPMQITNIHRIITQQHGWLNTSRALKPEDLQGRIILLDFWTLGCINCMRVIPDLHALEEQFGDKLTVIGVHSAKFKNEQDSENIRQAILRYNIHHPVVNDFDFSTWKAMGIRAWPTFVLINPQGTIASTYSGEGHRAELESDITKLIQKYDGKINSKKLPIALEADKQKTGVLSFPSKLATDGKLLFVADSGHERIVVMTLDGKIQEIIGSGKTGQVDGDFASASFSRPQGLAYKDGLLYIADTNNHALRVADLKTKKVTTLQTKLASPWALAFYPDTNHLTIAMAGSHQLWNYDIKANKLSLMAGNGNESIDDGKLPDNSLSQPSGLSALDDKLYFVDAESSALRVFSGGDIHTLIGVGLFDFGYKEGARDTALLQHPLGVYAGEGGIYIADAYNHSIRIFDPKTGKLSNFIGHNARGKKDGTFAEAELNEPNDILQIGNKLYIADSNNIIIRVADLTTKMVATLNITNAK